ncbi:MAG: YwaF family protein [Clostridiales bacterium]|nr:YwaF family protein [Clostridiales bacterium]
MMFNWNSDDARVLPIALLTIVICGVILRVILKKKNEKWRKLPLGFLAVCIVLLEVSKQIYYNIYEPFTLYVLPLHFCSTFVWLMPLAQFTKGKVNRFFKPMPFYYSLVVIFLMYAFPRVLLGYATSSVVGNFHNVHTLLFHHAIVTYCIFSLLLGDYKPQKSDYVPLVTGVVFYTAYAVPIAYILNVNYVNILKSDFAPFEQLRLAAGQVVYNIVLFLFAVAAILCIWIVYYKLYNVVTKRKEMI